VRPYGRTSILLGKYLTAVGWSALAGWISLTVCLLIVQPDGGLRMFWVLAVLVLLSCLAYGSVYTFLGVVVLKKPMVAAVAYSLILEFIVGWIPAMINEFTINMRLRSLLVHWIDLDERTGGPVTALVGGPGSPIKHIAILLGIAAAFLTASAWILQQKTLVTASDS